MKNLFEQNNSLSSPLAERVRPVDFKGFFGQEHLLGKNKPLRRMIETDNLTSMILWGPAGTGKTSVARIVALNTNAYFEEFSAVTSGVNDLRRVVGEAKERKSFHNQSTVLFVDEIHRFNKSQQDGFLPHVERGVLILIGATTENPGFEINSALLSRSTIFELKKLTDKDIEQILEKALSDTERGLGKRKLILDKSALAYLVKIADGDARKALNTLEISSSLVANNKHISLKIVSETIKKRILSSYKKGENHYDLISAFIKSMRGSNPDAAIYWLARMIEAGEDPKFIARRMIIFASEDIGNAAPMALVLANACFDAVDKIGLPEAQINLAQGVTYLASAPKSNSSYLAINNAVSDIKNEKIENVPIHLKNAPTKLAKNQGHGKDYKYPHNYPGHYIEQEYLPPNLKNKKYYIPTTSGAEAEISTRLKRLKKDK